ncbi:MAG: serine/threonine-protein phosphatase [Clostridia bacterium]|nr:serine/threonine-protein phosphatase [Clostridia bacterium]MBQ9600186.1 serine/threonine-protein phosphatase [Clostridia bacterium]
MRAVSITNRGGRENNEDFICSVEVSGIWCFVLCDGLGGHECGEVASRLVAETICAEFEKKPELSQKAAEEYIEAATNALITERTIKPGLFDMSTTVTLLLTNGERAVWAHVGDSRVYFITGGEISLITDDHSMAFMEFQGGLISYDEIRTSPNQNRLTHCIGGISSSADISEEIPLKSGDAFLLCSDGFWEYVRESDIEKSFAESFSPKEWLEKMLEVLHKNEIERNDNYSAIAVMI